MVTAVPPSTGPVAGETVISEGGRSVITSAPDEIETSVPRFTARFFGPVGTVGGIEKLIWALVEATEDILPPKVGEPGIKLALDVVNATPVEMSSPPTVIV